MMKPGLQLRVSQQLALTPQLQQSIKLLQLSTLELQQEVQAMLETNPFLEDASSPEDTTAAETLSTEYAPARNDAPDSASSNESSAETELSEMDWAQAGDTESSIGDEDWRSDRWDGEGYSAGSNSDDENSGMFEWVPQGTTLSDHLMQQALTLNLSDEDKTALTILIESLDDNGYLVDDIPTIADLLLTSHQEALDYELEQEDMVERLQCALGWLQCMSPAGVGARTLSECLCIQLKLLSDTPEKTTALAICTNHLELLAKRDYKRLCAELAVSEDTVSAAVALILALDPKPGRQFARAADAGLVPDVIVKKSGTQWKATLNPDVVPKIRVNDIYARALRGHKGQDGAQALQQRLQEARWFIKNIQQRFDTILRVSQAIVERQKNFFTHGEIAMRPLVLREIADELGLHESTISRVTTAKYMATPFGIYELKYFFGSALATDAGGNASSTAVRALIKQLIANEDPHHPLSDNDIAKLISEQGIQVARRTVAKYREGLKIATASLRKTI